MRVVFWQNILAFHQVSHLTALAAHPDTQVVWVVHEAITPDRLALGWQVPEAPGVQVVIAPRDAEIQRLVCEQPDDSIHVFSGIHQEPTARKAFYLSLKTSAQIGLLNETPFPGRLRDFVSPIFHGGHRLLYGKRISFILAMGHMAVDFYRSVGYPSSIVFPYGYFLPTPPLSAVPSANGPVQILYLGQLVERKGVDILLRALGPLKELNWALTLIGSGERKDALIMLTKELGLQGRVTFCSALQNEAAMQKMAQSDFFVLPSRHDGWGVVVNEALMRGIPVICSDRCGTADLLGEPWRGEVFASGSVAALEAALRRWISHGKRAADETQHLQGWSQCITGDAAAEYLRRVLEFTRAPIGKRQDERPMPPWQEASRTETEESRR